MLLEIHKHTHGVEMVSDAPTTHIFSERYVAAETREGWLSFAGDPVSYEVTADPNGKLAHAGPMQLTLPGDKLVMRVLKDGELHDFVYRITHYPVPQFFRLADEREADGIRIAPEYGLQLVEG